MRNLNTIIHRIQCDLPITDEEACAAREYIDGVLKRHRKFQVAAFAIPSAILFVMLCADFFIGL